MSAIVRSAFGVTTAEIRRFARDRLLSTWLDDRVWQTMHEPPGAKRSGSSDHTSDGHHSPPEGWTWESLKDTIHAEATAWGRLHGLSPADRADLAAEVLHRLVLERSRHREVRFPRAWARTVFASLACAASRGRADGPLSPRNGSSEMSAWAFAAMRAPPTAVDHAAHRELAAQAPALLDELPAPYREIANLQYLRGWSRAEIGRWLKTWRPIQEEGIRTLFRKTHQMLKAIGRGKIPSSIWPGRYDSKKNPWMSSPPPPPCFASIGYEQLERWRSVSDERIASPVQSSLEQRWAGEPSVRNARTAGFCKLCQVGGSGADRPRMTQPRDLNGCLRRLEDRAVIGPVRSRS